MKRAALYIRVSHEEQALHGYSLGAQQERLKQYAREKGYAIHDIYIDEGYSARTSLRRRKEFMRLMSDVESNHLDVILFIKLDRWFRNVKDFYTYESLLEAHHVTWETTDEDYNTGTAQGRLHLNIKLSIAQNESDMTSERIKFVFAHKKAKGEAISGKLPLGYRIENKHIVPDDTSHIIPLLFQFYKEHQSIHQTMEYLRHTFHIDRTYQCMSKLLRNRKYLGILIDGTTYMPALVDEILFEEVQQLLRAHQSQIKQGRESPLPLFKGLLLCPHCHHRLIACHRYYKDKVYTYYHCPEANHNSRCSHHKLYNEQKLEQILLPMLYDCYEAQNSDAAHQNFHDFLSYYCQLSTHKKQKLWQQYFPLHVLKQ